MVRSRTIASPAGDARPREIPGLMGLRAVMGTWVVADHLFVPMATLLPALTPLRPVLSGGIALDTFFILSGFVISHVYATRLATFDRRAYGTFLWARIARLWPTHVFALGVAAVLVAAGAAHGDAFGTPFHYTVGTFLGNLAMLQAIPGVDPWNAPSWSVSSEMAAYVLFPVVASLLIRRRRGTAVALAALVVAAGMVVLPLLSGASPAVVFASLSLVRPLGEFVLGCALWVAWRHGIRQHWCWDVVAVAALGSVAALMYCASSDPTGLYMYAGPMAPLRVLAVALLAVVVLAVTGSTGPVHRLLGSRPMRWAGRTSYSRYLLHLPVLGAVALLIPADVVDAPVVVRALVVMSWFVAVYAVGGLTHRLVEEPARRRMRRLARPGRRNRAAAAPAPAPAAVEPTVPTASRPG